MPHSNPSAGNAQTFTGSAAADTIIFTSENTTVEAGAGANTVTGTSGHNIINGGDGVDTITVTTGDNTINAGGGANTITATSGNNHITSGDGVDTITVTTGDNIIDAGYGANTITATSGNNHITSGDGVDTITVTSGDNTIVAGDGANTITATSGENTITTGDGVDTITAGDGGNFIIAGDGANTITTGAGNDIVFTGVDIDTITTGAGDDLIHITGGTDTVTAGAGTDTLIVDYSAATGAVAISALAGTVAAGYAGNISGLGIATFAGVENFDITSGGFNDVITTGDGTDIVRSGAGDDLVILSGGTDEAVYTMIDNSLQKDIYQGGNGVDTLTLELTTAQWFNPLVQTDITNYLAFQALHTDSITGEADSAVFQFTAFDLSASEFESLNVTVDGVVLDPTAEAVYDTAGLNEDDTATSFTSSVLDNDGEVGSLAYSVALISGPSEGVLAFNPGTAGAPDGSYSFDPNDDFEDLAEGETRDVSFVYEVQDAFHGSNQATVTLTVTGTNDSPVVTTATGGNEGAVTEAGNEDDGTVVPGTASATGTLTSSDVDTGATSAWTGDTTGTYGSFAIDTAGAWTYTLDNTDGDTDALAEGETLTDTFTATVTDDFSATATQVVTVTVTGTNDSPVVTTAIGGNAGAVTEAGNLDGGAVVAGTASATGTLTSSDVDTGATSAWTGDTTGTYGSFAIDTAGAWTYTLDNADGDTDALAEGETVTDTFTATVTDDFGATATQVVTVTITGTNDSPVITTAVGSNTGAVTEAGNLDNGTVVPGTASATGTLASTDVDTGASATWTGDTTGTYGSFAIDTAGAWTYILDNADGDTDALAEGETVTDTFTATVTDDFGATATQLVTVTVTGTNDSPVITTIVGNNEGAVTEAGNLDDGTVVAGNPDTAGTLTSSDVDTGATSAWTGDTTGTYGSFAIDTAGAWTYILDNADGDTDALAEGETVTDTFTATVTDDFGATATQLVTVTVTGTNDSPVITTIVGNNEGAVTEAGNLDDGTVVAGNPDAAGTLTSSDVDTGATSAWTGNATGTYGSFTIDTVGAWTYTLDNADGDTDALAEGETVTDTFTATVTDDFGATATQVVTVTVTGTNDSPVVTTAIGGNAGAVTEAGNLDGGAVVAGTASATGTLTSSDVDTGATSAWTGDTTGTYGSFAIDTAGAWTYTLDNADGDTDALAEGETVTDTFTATVTDDFGATATQVVTVTVTGTNDSPVITTATGDNEGAVTEAGNLDGGAAVAGNPDTAGTLTSSDVDTGATSAWTGDTTGTYGSFAIDTAGAWTYTLDNADGDTDALAEGETVTDTFTATVTDDFGATATQLVTVTVTGTNDSPVITTIVGNNEGAVTEAGNLDDGTVVAGNPDAAGTLTSSDVDTGATSAWTGNATGTYGSFAIDTAGAWTYTLDNTDGDTDALAEGETVTDTFTATVTDEFGATATQDVTVTVTGTNDSPVIEGGGNVLFVSDSGVGSDIATVLTGGGHQVDVVLDDFTSGSNPALLGDLSDYSTIFWSASGDQYGSNHTDSGVFANLNQFVMAGGRVFVTGYDSIASPNDGQLISFLGGTSSDDYGLPSSGASGANSLTTGVVDIVGVQPTGHYGDTDTLYTAPGTTVVVDSSYGGTGASWSLLGLGDGEIAYVSNGQYGTSGSHSSWTNTSSGGDGAYNAALLNFAHAGSQFGSISEDVTEAGNLDGGAAVAGNPDAAGTLTSSDVDTGATSAWTGNATGTYGSFTIDTVGAWTYTLDNADGDTDALAEGETVTDTFTATVTDDFGATATQVVTVTITGTNDSPVITTAVGSNTGAVTEAGNLDGGAAVAGNPDTAGTLTSSDVDTGATSAWTGDTTGTYGSFAIDTAGAWTYTLDNADGDTDALAEGETVTDTFTATVTDDFGATATQVVTVTITGTNDAPIATADTATTAENTVLTIDVLANDTDVDLSNTHTVDAVSVTSGSGTVAIVGNQVQWSPGTDYDYLAIGESATVELAYDMSDNDNGTDNSTVTITVEGSNDAPVAVGDSAFVTENDTINIDVLLNDSDIEGDTIEVTTAGGASNGTVTVNGDGTISYAPDDGFSGSDNFTYVIADEHGANSSSTVSVVVGVANSTTVGTDVFLQGNFMEMGVSGTGSLGTANGAPVGYHPAMNNSKISYLVDLDGWNSGGAGNPPRSGDFTLPGSPVDGYVVGFTQSGTTRNFVGDERSGFNELGASTVDTTVGAELSATTTGASSGLSMTQVISLNSSDTYYSTMVSFTNTTGTDMDDVRYMRTFDPDQDQNTYGTYNTLNDVLASANDSFAISQATGPTSGISVNLVSFDTDARASNFGFSNHDPYHSNAYDSPIDLNGASVDQAITLNMDFGTIAAGQTVTKEFFTSMNGQGDANDMSIGTNGADVINSGFGDDIILGLDGNDIINGGAGNDVFVFGDGNGADTIQDFTAGAGSEDQIELVGISGFLSFLDVQANSTQVGANTVIDLGAGNSVTLSDTLLESLHQDDFIF
jgi:VCBS repeat-containing protein